MTESLVPVIITGLCTALASLGVGSIIVKRMSRDVDSATALKINAEAKQTAQQTASTEVNTIREVLAEVRAERATIAERLGQVESRVELLEERERHMLTRAAVHEAWDSMAFAALVAMNPQHPPPPPLTLHADEGPHGH